MERWQFTLLVLAVAALVGFIRWLPFRPKGSRHGQIGQATIISKRVKQNSGMAAKTLSRWDYMVIFQVGNQELELYVTQTDFHRLKEGMTGQLVWQYENLVSFEPENNSEEL